MALNTRIFARLAMTTPIALTIAGSDSSGGAGIQADLKTFAALGVYGASVITALTAQNTQGVSGIHQVPAEFVTAQIDAVFSDLAVGAVKIGMVAHPPVIDAIVAGLKRWSPKHVVLDPVMVATSGDRLLAAEAVEALRTKLIPLASVITPNLPEAAALLDEGVAADEAAVEKQGRRLLALGCKVVLIKGGHGRGRREHRLSGRFLRCHRTRRAAHRDKEYPRHRLLAVLGDCRGTGEGRETWKPPCATPRPGSAPRLPPQTVSASGMATARSIIFRSFISRRPANAGTHIHRALCEVSTDCPIVAAVWVPRSRDDANVAALMSLPCRIALLSARAGARH